MDPVGGAPALPQQLVEGAVAGDPVEPFPSLREGGKMQVGRLTRLVLAARHTTHQSVEPGATIAGADCDGFPCVLAQGFQHRFAERYEVRNEGFGNTVVNARRLGRAGAGKFR